MLYYIFSLVVKGLIIILKEVIYDIQGFQERGIKAPWRYPRACPWVSPWSRLSRRSFAVGALARLNNNFAFLQPEAGEIAEMFSLKPVSHNPFMNNIAQLVECVHVVHESLLLIDELLASEQEEPRQELTPKCGTGVGAVEVPRGILYHCYEFDDSGRILKCDCVIPTNQNHGNIQHDLEELAGRCSEAGRTDR